MSKAVKILVVGDGAVGKTCLAKMFVDGVMPDNYNPTVFENHSVKLSFEEDVSLKFVFYKLFANSATR